MLRKIEVGIIAIIAIGLLGATTINGTNVLAQGTSLGIAKSSPVTVSMDAKNTQTVSSGSARVHSFDTTFTISGDVAALKADSDLIKKTVTGDFNHSPTIGYVKHGGSHGGTTSNPYANTHQIDEKISTELHNAILAAEKSTTKRGEIKCNFGMELPKFKCTFSGLVG